MTNRNMFKGTPSLTRFIKRGVGPALTLALTLVASTAFAWRSDCDGDGTKETYERSWCPLKSNEDCNKTITYNGRKIRYCRNRALSNTNSTVDKAVIFVHGHDIRARKYYDRVVDLGVAQGFLSSSSSDADTTVIAPFFMHEEDVDSIGLSSAYLHWSESGWERGNKSVNSSGTNYSSYEMLDFIVKKLIEYNSSLDEIVVVGYSAGAQFVQKYLAGTFVQQTHAAPAGVDMKFVVMAPQSFMWLLDDRASYSASYLESNCSGYNDYKYGIDGRSGYSYMNDKSDLDLVQDALLKRVRYIVGDEDTEVDSSLSCKETFQGNSRYSRMVNFYYEIDDAFRWAYPTMSSSLSYTYRNAFHKLLIVDGANHSSSQLLHTSESGVAGMIFGND